MKLSLVVTQGKPEGKEIPIRLTQFLIGRDPECHLRPSSPLISKRHCALLVRDGKVFLRDFDSTNGTIVNEQPLKGEAQLKDGDEVKVGPLGFRIKITVSAEDTAKPSPLTVADQPVPTTPTPAPKPAAPRPVEAKRSGVDEDSVMEMLLNVEGAPPLSPSDDPIPPGSTIMQIVSQAAQKQQEEEEAAKKEEKPEEKKPKTTKQSFDPAATSNAAKAILDKYMRRQRG
jgi:predicted component of type VI protein secretion system